MAAGETITIQNSKHVYEVHGGAWASYEILYDHIDDRWKQCRENRGNRFPVKAKPIQSDCDQYRQEERLWRKSWPTDETHESIEERRTDRLQSPGNGQVYRK